MISAAPLPDLLRCPGCFGQLSTVSVLARLHSVPAAIFKNRPAGQASPTLHRPVPAEVSDKPILSCLQCDFEFEVWQHVPLITSTPEHYNADIDRSIFTELLARSNDMGTAKAVRTMVVEGRISDVDFYNIMSARRGCFLTVLSPGKEKTVLELGCGWGELTLTLAQTFGLCYSVERTKERAAWLYTRSREFQLHNLVALCGVNGTLPFADSSFDCVVVNSLAAPASDGDFEGPHECMLRNLKEVARVLRPTGAVFIKVENRFGLRKLLGASDTKRVHLPSRIMQEQPDNNEGDTSHCSTYRAASYTTLGYKKLLAQVGFTSSRQFVPYPDFTRTEAIIDPSCRPVTRDCFVTTAKPTIMTRIKSNFLLRMPEQFAAIASSDKVGPPIVWFEKFGEFAADQLGWPGVGTDVQTLVGLTCLTVAVRQQSRKCLAKIPTSPQSCSEVEDGFIALKSLQQKLIMAPLPVRVPKPLVSGLFDGVQYYIQEFLQQESCVSRSKLVHTDALHKWLAWASSLATTSQCIDPHLEPEQFARCHDHWGTPLTSQELMHYHQIIDTAGSFRVPCHGDLWEGNFLNTVDGPALIDWPDYQNDGLPLHDMFHFHLFAGEAHNHWQRMLQYAESGFPTTVAEAMRASFYVVRSAMPSQQWTSERLWALFYLYIVVRIVRHGLRRPYNVHSSLEAVRRLLGSECPRGIARLADVFGG